MTGRKGYAALLAHGIDTYKQSYNVSLKPAWHAVFAEAKEKARTLDARGGARSAVEIPTIDGPELVEVASFATAGASFLFGNDDLQFIVRNPSDWQISARLLSAGLWEHGRDALLRRVDAILFEIARPNEDRKIDTDRLSRLDYAMDFHSPDFTREMVPAIVERIVATSGVKKYTPGQFIGTGFRVETIYIGSRSSAVQVVIYDKGREISEASGKTWMFPLWEQSGQWTRPPQGERARDVWRIEVRFAGKFFKDRRLVVPDDAMRELPNLITEALIDRRLCVRAGDINRARWPIAPLWTAALAVNPGDRRLPLGRMVTKARAAHVSMLADQAAGIAATAAALHHRDQASPDEFLWALAETLDEIRLRADADPESMIARARRIHARYRYIDEAR